MTSVEPVREYTLSSFRILAGLGEGGMARVFLVVSNKRGGFEKLLVLKVLRSELGTDSEFHDMFLQEARIAARLNHPNVVQTYEVGEDDGKLFIAMEYLEGHALSAVIKTVGRASFPLDVGVQILSDALQGLHYAHELASFDGTPVGLVHRDVSPQNLFVQFTGDTKIVDFGIAKVAGGSVHTRTGVIKGKLGYMAPEQIHGKTLDRRADIFSVGVMLWEMLSRRRLVQAAEDELAVLARRMEGADPSIRTVAPADAPEELLAICERAMAGDPEDRYATALEFHEALASYAGAKRIARRDVAALMQEHFREERSKVQKLIDRQLTDVHAAPVDIITERAIPGLVSSSDVRRAGTVDVEVTGVTTLTQGARRRPVWLVPAGLLALAGAGAIAWLNQPTHVPAAAPSAGVLPVSSAEPLASVASPPASAVATMIAPLAAPSAGADAGSAQPTPSRVPATRGARTPSAKPVDPPVAPAASKPTAPKGRHGIDEADPYK